MSADAGPSIDVTRMPDGMPVVWAANMLGARLRGRVYGPQLMLRFCERCTEVDGRGGLSYATFLVAHRDDEGGSVLGQRRWRRQVGPWSPRRADERLAFDRLRYAIGWRGHRVSLINVGLVLNLEEGVQVTRVEMVLIGEVGHNAVRGCHDAGPSEIGAG